MKNRQKSKVPVSPQDTLSKGRGFIYVVRIVGTDIVKIGLSIRNPERRVQQIADSLPYPIERVLLAFVPKNVALAEFGVHSYFAAKRIKNEWFRLTESDFEYMRKNGFSTFDVVLNDLRNETLINFYRRRGVELPSFSPFEASL